MWNRKELKARGKSAFKANYWLAVLMAVILMAVAGGGTGLAGSAGSAGFNVNYNFGQNDADEKDAIQLGESISDITEDPTAVFNEIKESAKSEIDGGALAAIIAVVVGVVAVAAAASLVLQILLLNPIQVGCQSFFVRNSEGQGAMGDLGRAFKPNWRGNVKTMFLKDLFLFLWGLLFFIPAIIKGYSYRMVPYILADHPEMSGTEVITMSRQMMNGSKWRTFVLDLSFIGWYLLSALTLGILGIFYVAPYKSCTDAELYQTLKHSIQE